MGSVRRMGYVKLKILLKRKGITLRDVALECQIELNKLYECTSQYRYDYTNVDLTEIEKQKIYNAYFVDSNIPLEEVFKKDGDIGYEFDTVYKIEAGRKHRY